jgi:hypothetical protein
MRMKLGMKLERKLERKLKQKQKPDRETPLMSREMNQQTQDYHHRRPG